jgi:predicted Zn finger-like uncharacterized protein
MEVLLIFTLMVSSINSFVVKESSSFSRQQQLPPDQTTLARGVVYPAMSIQLSNLFASRDDNTEPNGTAISSSSSTLINNNNRQGLYGTDLEMPSSYVRCAKCQTAYALSTEDLGGRGRRLECSVCNHAWFQTKDRLLTLTSEFELSPLPERDLERIQSNLNEGKSAKYMGDKKLYVGNLAFQCHEDDLYEIFGRFGDVGEVNLVRDEDGRPRGFGFVIMRTEEGGDRAITELDGMIIRGRNIAVRESNS